MIIFHEADTTRNYLQRITASGRKTGFVPTMGALHEGHFALLNKAKEAGDFTVVSIFVNPTQFNDPADYARYPVTLENDIRLLEENGCQLLFLPSVDEIYPSGTATGYHYELGYLEKLWEGYYRPGHFQGVCQVMHRLLDLVRPQHLYMGLKDYQQCMVVARLLELTGMEKDTELIPCPTLREPDGLAMSSRNRRLSETDRRKAPMLYHSMKAVKENLQPGLPEPLLSFYRQRLTNNGFRLDYFALADARSLAEINNWDGKQKLVLLLAAFCGEVRLIDNLRIC